MQSPDAGARHLTRRRVRKGTRSCWECKRRKLKCNLTAGTPCDGCRQRGSNCISQEYPEDSRAFGHVKQASTIAGDHGEKPSPAPSVGPDPHLLEVRSTVRHHHEKLSQFLHSALPSRADLERLCSTQLRPSASILTHEILTLPYSTLRQKGLKSRSSLLAVPGPHLHPALIARYMLQLAIFLQQVRRLEGSVDNLSESALALQDRMAHLAHSLVTTNEELSATVEGVECIMLESMYQANVGNLRKSWVAGRRAIDIAHLMGLERPGNLVPLKRIDYEAQVRPEYMWFRINFLDRHLSLVLGLAGGLSDYRSVSDAEHDDPSERLERKSCVLASQILERNALKRASMCSPDEFLERTRSIDRELQRVARTLPSKWWLEPSLDHVNSQDPTALFWDTRRLFAQVLHYNLLNQLHLHYMLRSSYVSEDVYQYSRHACVTSSREIISRYNTLRTMDKMACGWSCRIVDILALMAAMTLLLAHLDSPHAASGQNLLAHRYLADRAAIEQVQEHMEELNRLNPNALNAESGEILKRLLSINIDTPNDPTRVSVHTPGDESDVQNLGAYGAISVHVPYFGIIRITQEGVTKVRSSAAPNRDHHQPRGETHGSSSSGATPGLSDISSTPSGHPHFWSILSAADGTSGAATPPSSIGELPTSPCHQHGATTGYQMWPCDSRDYDLLTPPEEFPNLTAVGDEWPLQGVDLNFFDSTLRGFGNSETHEYRPMW